MASEQVDSYFGMAYTEPRSKSYRKPIKLLEEGCADLYKQSKREKEREQSSLQFYVFIYQWLNKGVF